MSIEKYLNNDNLLYYIDLNLLGKLDNKKIQYAANYDKELHRIIRLCEYLQIKLEEGKEEEEVNKFEYKENEDNVIRYEGQEYLVVTDEEANKLFKQNFDSLLEDKNYFCSLNLDLYTTTKFDKNGNLILFIEYPIDKEQRKDYLGFNIEEEIEVKGTKFFIYKK